MPDVKVNIKSEAEVSGIRQAKSEVDKLTSSTKANTAAARENATASRQASTATDRMGAAARRSSSANAANALSSKRVAEQLGRLSSILGPVTGQMANLIAVGGKIGVVVLGFLGLKKAVEEFGRQQGIKRQEDAIARLTDRLGVSAPQAAEIFKRAMEGDAETLKNYGRILGETLTQQDELERSSGTLRTSFNRLFAAVGGAISRTGILQSGIDGLVTALDFWGEKLEDTIPETLRFSDTMGQLPGPIRTVEQAAKDLAQAKQEARDSVAALNKELREEIRLLSEQEQRQNRLLAAQEQLAQARIQQGVASGQFSQEEGARLQAASRISFQSARSLVSQNAIRGQIEARQDTRRAVAAQIADLRMAVTTAQGRVGATQQFEAANARVIEAARRLEEDRAELATVRDLNRPMLVPGSILAHPSAPSRMIGRLRRAASGQRSASEIEQSIQQQEALLRLNLRARGEARSRLPGDVRPLEEEERALEEAAAREAEARPGLFETSQELTRGIDSSRGQLGTEQEVLRIQTQAETVRESARRGAELGRTLDEARQLQEQFNEGVLNNAARHQLQLQEQARKIQQLENRAKILRE